ncbi:MAG TPA: carbonic anhydrase [Myxococcota bacterium]
MRYLPELFERNRAWAAAQVAEDPDFFRRLCGLQAPRHLWIGCADSRVPANQIVGLQPGELFVHRNVGNVFDPADPNAVSVLQYAVEVLGVRHVIVCGHYECGGVLAAFGGTGLKPPLDGWIDHLRRVRAQHEAELVALPDREARWRRLCELNVAAQVDAVCATELVREAWARGQELYVHGWIYDLRDGLLRDLELSVSGPTGR